MNGRPIYLMSALDQGYWRGGLLTAIPSPVTEWSGPVTLYSQAAYGRMVKRHDGSGRAVYTIFPSGKTSQLEIARSYG